MTPSRKRGAPLGSRNAAANTGNHTDRRGRKLRRRILLSQEAAEALRLLWLRHPSQDEDALVARLILREAEQRQDDPIIL